MSPSPSLGALCFILVAAPLLAAPLLAVPGTATWQPIGVGEQQLTALPGQPEVPAVVLFKKAELHLRAPGSGVSELEVRVRTKILTESGKRFGQVSIGHGAHMRLAAFEGRTVTADGAVTPLAEEARFVEQSSRVRQRFLTKAAFPAVAVGAILDYRFTLQFDSPFFLEPWTFEEPLPVLLSEIVYHQPFGMSIRHRSRHGSEKLQLENSQLEKVQSEKSQPREVRAGEPQVEISHQGGDRSVRLWLENLAPVAEEPYSVAWQDLAHQVLIFATGYTSVEGRYVPLLDSWKTVVRVFKGNYQKLLPRRSKLRQLARRLISDCVDDSRVDDCSEDGEAAVVLHRFVRDEIAVEGQGILPAAGETLDSLLERRRGSYAAQAVLLRELLVAVDIEAQLVWATDWRDGQADLQVPNPGGFEKVLVQVPRDSGPGYLDPGDRSLAAWRLSPTQEGTAALLADPSRPRVITLPASPATANKRHAMLHLSIGIDGQLQGSGRLELSGHHAWFYLRRRQDAAATRDSWQAWLENQFNEFAVTSVRVAERLDEQRIELEWLLLQRPSAVLGDEVTWRPSLPLGPMRQRYTTPPELRRSPVRISFPDRDELELSLHWPADWQIDLQPADLQFSNAIGAASAQLEIDAEARLLTYRRQVQLTASIVEPGPSYRALRDFYAAVMKHDSRDLVLLRD